jgi:site-specific DNA-methyltransferase (adenine-specific)|tara:strand:+ start:47 stop:1222 length:1176 start_codon:yes stop_codon:yes gene_type:complete
MSFEKETIKNATIYHGDCMEVLESLENIDSCVADPPYGLSFMGKKWDYDVPKKELWERVFASMKQGAHLLSFFGSRTYHRGVIPIEDAGFDIRDQLMWLYGSGFPKSHNIGKAVEGNSEWEGWGTALKPAHEPIVMARKPFKGSVAENVLEHGTGGINIDGCRVGTDDKLSIGSNKRDNANVNFGMKDNREEQKQHEQGRFPANVIHDGSEEVLEIFPQTGKSSGGRSYQNTNQMYSGGWADEKGNKTDPSFGDEGTAARYFYCAKASKQDRDEGLDGFVEKMMGMSGGAQSHGEGYSPSKTGEDIGLNRVIARKNTHPTVKPTELMRYLCRLVTPKGGVVLDPFMGSGSTGKGALLEGFKFIGIEVEREYFDIACARLEAVQNNIQETLF